MRVFDLALKDMSQLVRDWQSGLFLLAMPIVFTVMLGLIFGAGGGEQDPRLPVGFLDQDGDSLLSTHLFTLLDGSSAIRPEDLGRANLTQAERKVRDQDLAAAVIVPAGYSDEILAGQGGVAKPTVIVDPASSGGATAQGEIQAAITRLLGSVKVARLSFEAVDQASGPADEAARQRLFEDALAQAIAAWAAPPLTVTVGESGAIAQEEEDSAYNGYAHTSAGIMVQFAMAGLIGSGTILLLERKSGAMRRMLTTAITRWEIILGHFIAMFLIVLAQMVILIAFGQLALGVDYMREAIAIALIIVPLALWAASLGLIIGVLAKSDDQVVVFSLIPMFVLAGMGGAWFPLEFTPEAFQTIGHLMPTAWAIDGLENIVVRGLGMDSVLLPAGILLAYAVGFFVLAVWLFKFE